MNKQSILKVGIFIIFSTIFVWIISCAVNPVTGKKELMLISEAQETALGKQTDGQIVETYGIYKNPQLANYIDNLGQRMAKLTHRPNLDYSFKVLDSPVINAFAVPGGFIYVSRGFWLISTMRLSWQV